MSHTEKVSDLFGEYTEITEDEQLAAVLAAGSHGTFRVIEDEWDDDFTTRIIRRVEILDVSFDSV